MYSSSYLAKIKRLGRRQRLKRVLLHWWRRTGIEKRAVMIAQGLAHDCILGSDILALWMPISL